MFNLISLFFGQRRTILLAALPSLRTALLPRVCGGFNIVYNKQHRLLLYGLNERTQHYI